jgi:uroporphyrinogen-III synthase
VSRTLLDRTIVITRPADRSDRLTSELERRGARVIPCPSIELRPVRSAALTAAFRELADGRFGWIVLTSPATIGMLAERVGGPSGVRARVAAIGDGTAAAFRRYAGREADLIPASFTTAALARAFPRGSGPVLTPRADIAPEGLEDALRSKGYEPHRVDAYRTVLPRSLPREARVALASGEVDALTFTSASTVRGFIGAVDIVRGHPKVVCIGPVTAKQARAVGLHVHGVADPHTTDGLVARLERLFERGTPRRREGSAHRGG